jgi:hypothetical protein
LLQAFVKEHGHCWVPTDYKSPDGYRLGGWVSEQRAKRDSMLPERKARLDALGFIWNPHPAQWEEGFQHLQAFAKEHGHCMVPQKHVTANGYRLGQWVAVQRTTRDTISPERKARLDALGFIWDMSADEWEEGFRHLQDFVKEHWHCRVPQKHVTADGYRLGLWVTNQRARKDTIPPERKARLDTLGFIWDAIADQWEEGFQHLQAFVNEHGHCGSPPPACDCEWIPIGGLGYQTTPNQRQHARRTKSTARCTRLYLGCTPV